MKPLYKTYGPWWDRQNGFWCAPAVVGAWFFKLGICRHYADVMSCCENRRVKDTYICEKCSCQVNGTGHERDHL